MGSRRLNSIDEEAKLREKHQGLLQEYLVLQKECVSKKRKLKETNERKESLMDEIRFLKHRRDDFLLKRQSHKAVHHTDNIQLQKREAQYDVESSRRYTGASSSGEAFSNQKPPFNPLRNTGRVVKEEVAFPPVNLAKKPKNMFTNGKQAEKRKISWQDPLALKVKKAGNGEMPALFLFDKFIRTQVYKAQFSASYLRNAAISLLEMKLKDELVFPFLNQPYPPYFKNL